MKKVLLGTTALVAAGATAGMAQASDGIKLDVGGFFRTAYQVNFDSNNRGNLGHDHATDGIFSDAEIHFTGEVTLDNGLTAGTHVELEGETATDQIHQAYVYFSGGFGEFRIGSQDPSLETMCVTPPGSTANFGAFSPNQIAANTGGLISAVTGGAISSNSMCTGVDSEGTSQKFVYFTPTFSGFQLGVSYTPNEGAENQTNQGGPHVGMPNENGDSSRHNVEAYAVYNYEGDGWALSWGGGGGWEGTVERNTGGNTRPTQDFYQTGLNLTFGGFVVGGAFEYYHDLGITDTGHNTDAWVAGGGVSYNVDAWTVGLQYSHGRYDAIDADTANFGHVHQDRVALTGNYDMGPGIALDAEIAYTWTGSNLDTIANEDGDTFNPNGYDALEIGLGTSFEF